MLLYSAPILTFKRVIKEASVGEFSCIPYILTLFSCLTYSWYGFPIVSSGWKNLTVFLISSIGVIFEISFIGIYLWFAPREKKKLVILIVSLFLAIFGMTILISCFIIHTHHIRKVFVGSIGVLSAMLMYSSPLVAVKQVVRTRSVEFMPFYLSLFSFLTSLIWMVYGLLGRDPYITASFSWLSTVFTAEARKDQRCKTIWEMIWKWQPVVKTRQNISLDMEQLNCPKTSSREATKSEHPIISHKLLS
ncbi:hypothetical protein PVAP13_3KG084100 [Panicum virgatum]|nr:hypothetical protein PVAP13_3KG084100 [Panicum virgatum]